MDDNDQIELTANEPQANANAADTSIRDEKHRRQTFWVLFGCGLLQLPIWGMPMTFGIFQNAYTTQSHLGNTGVIGTTLNGVIYLSIPILSALLETPTGHRWRRSTAVSGTLLSTVAFLASSFIIQTPALIALQGVLAALGAAMLYTPTTLWVNAWFKGGPGGARATAYGVQFSSKNLVGTVCPFALYALIERLGVPWTLRVWAGIVLGTGLIGLNLLPGAAMTITGTIAGSSPTPGDPTQSSASSRHDRRRSQVQEEQQSVPEPDSEPRRPQKIAWSFLRHRTFYVYAIANAVFSSGYGLPQTYLPSYATSLLRLNGLESALLIALFNAPGILSCVGFGLLSDRTRISASAMTCISALGSATCVFLFWATKSNSIPGLLITFSICYGFFAGAYSSTWGGWMDELEKEARDANEAISTGLVYGLMNGARGVGFVVGGVSEVELLKAGSVIHGGGSALATKYGGLILYTGLSGVIGGWSVVWNGCSMKRRSGARA